MPSSTAAERQTSGGYKPDYCASTSSFSELAQNSSICSQRTSALHSPVIRRRSSTAKVHRTFSSHRSSPHSLRLHVLSTLTTLTPTSHRNPQTTPPNRRLPLNLRLRPLRLHPLSAHRHHRLRLPHHGIPRLLSQRLRHSLLLRTRPTPPIHLFQPHRRSPRRLHPHHHWRLVRPSPCSCCCKSSGCTGSGEAK